MESEVPIVEAERGTEQKCSGRVDTERDTETLERETETKYSCVSCRKSWVDQLGSIRGWGSRNSISVDVSVKKVHSGVKIRGSRS